MSSSRWLSHQFFGTFTAVLTASSPLLHPSGYRFFPVVRCQSTAASLPLPPKAPLVTSEVSKLFNTTKPDVQRDLESTDSLLPADVNLRNTEKWNLVLYQFDSCPFCRKVRVCLEFLRIPYSVRRLRGQSFVIQKG